jgi:hypothetical protein
MVAPVVQPPEEEEAPNVQGAPPSPGVPPAMSEGCGRMTPLLGLPAVFAYASGILALAIGLVTLVRQVIGMLREWRDYRNGR